MKNFYFIILFLSSSLVFGLSYEDQISIQATLENRLRPIVHHFDKDAIVMVKFKLKNKYQALPETPYVLNELAEQNDNQEKVIDRIDITLLTNKAELPKSFTKVLIEAASGVAPRISIRTQGLPEVSIAQAEEMKPKEEAKPSLLATIGNEMNSIRWVSSTLLLFLFVFAGGSLAVINFMKNSAASLSNNLERVANAIEVQTAVPAATPATAIVNETDLGFKEMFASLPKSGLGALLTDCYWGEHDAYAAFIWRRCSMERRRELCSEFNFLTEYSSYLAEVTEANLNAEQETYYLNPLSIAHLSNTTLTQLVSKTPGLLFKLSLIRRTSLLVNAQDKVELTRSALAQPLVSLPDFSKILPSAKRALPRKLKMPFKGVNEEREVLALANLSTELMESSPTLGWLFRLPDYKVGALLQTYSAKELATAWTGPEEVLEKLMGFLPRPKQELLRAYLLRITPSRTSPVFLAIQRQVMVALSEKIPTEGGVFDESKVA